MPIQEIQREPIVQDDLTPYRGSWVALREGKVIASAIDPIQLRDNDVVRDTDLLVLVPTNSEGTFLL